MDRSNNRTPPRIEFANYEWFLHINLGSLHMSSSSNTVNGGSLLLEMQVVVVLAIMFDRLRTEDPAASKAKLVLTSTIVSEGNTALL